MELACPNCETQFFVADNAIGPNGRKVRCSACQHTWQAKPAPAAAGTGAAAAKPAAAPAKPAAAPRPEADDEFHWPAETAAESKPASTANPAKPGTTATAGTKPADTPAAGAQAQQKPASSIYSSPLEASMVDAPEQKSGGKRIAVGVILLVLVAASYLFRDQIVAAYPDAARLYGLAGISITSPAATPGQPTSQ